MYQIFNPFTRRVSEMCNIIWLQLMFYEHKNTESRRLEPVVTLDVSREVVQEENTIEDERVYVEDIVKKEDPEDNESVNKSVSSGDASDDNNDGFIEDHTRAGRVVKPVPVYNHRKLCEHSSSAELL